MNDEAYSMLPCRDGGYLIIGQTQSMGAGKSDFYLIRINEAGVKLWEKTIGGTENDLGLDLIHTADNNFFAVGMTESFGKGGRDMLLVKIDASGNTLWKKTFGATLDDGATSICRHPDGSYMVLGFTYNYGKGDRELYLFKINEQGDSLASYTYGDTGYEEAHTIEPTADGGFIISAHTSSFNHPEHNMYALKIDAGGKVQWENNYGSPQHDGAEAAIETASGNFLVAGTTQSSGFGNEDMYLVKTDHAGNKLLGKENRRKRK